jgi:hypothetical protein
MRKSKNRQVAPTFAFVVDGKTEVWYLQMLKQNEKNVRQTIKPEIPQKKSIEDQFKMVEELLHKEYSKVFWIIDLDTIIKEEREAKKGKEKPLEAFKRYRKKLEKHGDKVTVVVNNPCIEFWFLLHFDATSKRFDNCEKAEQYLKKYLSDYEKSEVYFKKRHNDLYLKLKPYRETAIKNASDLGRFDADEPLKAVCEMFLIEFPKV